MPIERLKYATYCPKCEEEGLPFCNVYNFGPDRIICPIHNHNTPMIETKLTYPEYNVLRKISKNLDFWRAMRKLKEDDIIEYELKMSQFRAQVGDGESDFVSNQVTCPYCHSVNVRKLSTTGRMVSTGFFGLGSSKVGKQFHCNGCGADF